MTAYRWTPGSPFLPATEVEIAVAIVDAGSGVIVPIEPFVIETGGPTHIEPAGRYPAGEEDEVTQDPAAPLPSPDEVAATIERMKLAIEAEDDRLTSEISRLREALEEAEMARQIHHERYPMFFPEAVAPERTPGRGYGSATISVEQLNVALRWINDKPRKTRKQIARGTNFSESWTGYVLAELIKRGLVDREKHGRALVYWPTGAGTNVLNRGGIPADTTA